jgi:hypothetical protein
MIWTFQTFFCRFFLLASLFACLLASLLLFNDMLKPKRSILDYGIVLEALSTRVESSSEDEEGKLFVV